MKDLIHDLDQGTMDIRQPIDEADEFGECLADLHQKYLDLLHKLENEKEKGKHQQKQVCIRTFMIFYERREAMCEFL